MCMRILLNKQSIKYRMKKNSNYLWTFRNYQKYKWSQTECCMRFLGKYNHCMNWDYLRVFRVSITITIIFDIFNNSCAKFFIYKR